MHKESEVFLPPASTYPKRVRNHRPPALSAQLHHLFERSLFYACCIFSVYTYAVYLGILTTYAKHRETSIPVLFYAELGIFIYSVVEFLLRIYGSQSRIRYVGAVGKWRFSYEQYLLIDLLLLLSYGVIFLLYFTGYHGISSALFLHGVRFLQLLRFVSLDRHIRSIPLLGQSIWDYRCVLLATVFLCFLLMLPTAYLLWVVEEAIETDGKFFFGTYIDSLWFTINSMATIGYGDTWPQTLLGRALTVTLCCAGLVLWTLPAGILSASLTIMDEKARERERLREPAAKLILAWWRLQSVNNRLRVTRNTEREKHLCKQVIAHMLYSQYCRQFRLTRYGASNENHARLRSDLHRILQHLQAIEAKLDANFRIRNE